MFKQRCRNVAEMSLCNRLMTLRLVSATVHGVVVIHNGIGVLSEGVRRNCGNHVVRVLITRKKKKETNTIIEQYNRYIKFTTQNRT